jgi:hypothetical protein
LDFGSWIWGGKFIQTHGATGTRKPDPIPHRSVRPAAVFHKRAEEHAERGDEQPRTALEYFNDAPTNEEDEQSEHHDSQRKFHWCKSYQLPRVMQAPADDGVGGRVPSSNGLAIPNIHNSNGVESGGTVPGGNPFRIDGVWMRHFLPISEKGKSYPLRKLL